MSWERRLVEREVSGKESKWEEEEREGEEEGERGCPTQPKSISVPRERLTLHLEMLQHNHTHHR